MTLIVLSTRCFSFFSLRDEYKVKIRELSFLEPTARVLRVVASRAVLRYHLHGLVPQHLAVPLVPPLEQLVRHPELPRPELLPREQKPVPAVHELPPRRARIRHPRVDEKLPADVLRRRVRREPHVRLGALVRVAYPHLLQHLPVARLRLRLRVAVLRGEIREYVPHQVRRHDSGVKRVRRDPGLANRELIRHQHVLRLARAVRGPLVVRPIVPVEVVEVHGEVAEGVGDAAARDDAAAFAVAFDAVAERGHERVCSGAGRGGVRRERR
eukprot:31231-Pelagococcus_subviridis.AAC.14